MSSELRERAQERVELEIDYSYIQMTERILQINSLLLGPIKNKTATQMANKYPLMKWYATICGIV